MTIPIAFLLPLLLLAACKDPPRETATEGPKVEAEAIAFPADSPQVAALTTAKVEMAKPVPLTLNGRLVWDEDRTVRLFPAFAGKVTKILVQPGDAVKAGQALALLASPDFGQAQSDANRAASDFALAENNVARLRMLHEHGVTATKDLQAAEADFQKAESERRRTQARLRLYGSRDNAVDQSFALTTPISGVVVEKNINPGQELRPDLSSANAPAMFVVTDPTHLWVQLDASEKDLPHLRKGVTVRLMSSAYPDENYPCVIEAIADFVDPNTRTIRVRGSLDNAARKLKGEMFVTAEAPVDGPSGMQVPARAVFLRGDKHYVFLAQGDGRFARREVSVGPGQDSGITILAGLGLGQSVVVEGSLLLQQLLAENQGK